MGVDDRVGSIDVGKDADLVIWDGYPLSSYGVPEKVLIDGDVYFDRSLPGLRNAALQGGRVMQHVNHLFRLAWSRFLSYVVTAPVLRSVTLSAQEKPSSLRAASC